MAQKHKNGLLAAEKAAKSPILGGLLYFRKREKFMKADLKNRVQKVVIEGKEYSFEYDFNAYSELEDETGCGVYQLYGGMVSEAGISLKKLLAILGCAMLKHHSAEEIDEIMQKIKEYPGLWLKVKECALAAFLLPLLPPEILEKTKIKESSKKKWE